MSSMSTRRVSALTVTSTSSVPTRSMRIVSLPSVPVARRAPASTTMLAASRRRGSMASTCAKRPAIRCRFIVWFLRLHRRVLRSPTRGKRRDNTEEIRFLDPRCRASARANARSRGLAHSRQKHFNAVAHVVVVELRADGAVVAADFVDFAVAGEEGVVAGRSDVAAHEVLAGAAGKGVVAEVAEEPVVPAAAVERIVVLASAQDVVAAVAGEGVLA